MNPLQDQPHGDDATFAKTLVRDGVITKEQLQAALKTQADLRGRGETVPIGEVLVRTNVLPSERLRDLHASRQLLFCPQCRKNFNVKNWSAGRSVFCPTCSVGLVLPPSDRTIDAGGSGLLPRPGATPEARDAAGKPFGPYRLLEELGRGGMGVVWKAWDPRLKRVVALKQVLAGDSADSAAVERFIREAQLAAKLRHPNIVGVHDVGEQDGAPYFTTDYIEAKPLDQVMKKPVAVRQAVEWVRAAAEALAYAHEQGVVHRDVKPSNFLIDKHGTLFVMDFGLAAEVDLRKEGGARRARLTMAGQMLGTPQYMSPEQAKGETDTLGPATDQFSLGVVLYELITGKPPFGGNSIWDLLRAIGEEEPAPPSRLNRRLHKDLETVCLKAMEKKAEKRYPGVREFAADLGRYLAGEPIEARPLTGAGRLARKLRRHRAIVIPSAAAVFLGLALGGWAVAGSMKKARDIENALGEAKSVEAAVADGTLERDLMAARDAWNSVLALDRGSRTAKAGIARVEKRLDELKALRDKALQASKQEAAVAEGNRKSQEEAGELLELGRQGIDAAVLYLYDRNANYEELVKKVEEGQKRIEQAIAKSPQFALAHHLLGRCWDLRGWDDRAEASWRKAIELRPEFGPPHFELGRLLMVRSFQLSLGTEQEERDANRPEAHRLAKEAVAEIDAARKGTGMDDPLQRAVMEVLTAYTAGDHRAARARAREGMATFEGKRGVEDLHWLEGIAAQGAGEASDGYDRAVALRPTHALALFCRANLCNSRGDLDGALRDNTAALRFQPRWAMAYYNRGAVLKDMKDFKGALKDYDRAVELRPDWAAAWGSRATVRQALRDFDGAIEDCNAALRINPRLAAALHNRGYARHCKGDTEEALKDYDAAIGINPRQPRTFVYRGALRRKKKDFAGASADAAAALALDPRFSEAILLRGLIRDDQGDVDGALAEYEAALRIEPPLAEAYYSRGSIRQEKGDLDGAMADYEAALKIDPRHVRALNNRGAIRYARGEVDAAIADFNAALEADPRDSAALNNRGAARKSVGDFDGAIADFDRAIQADPAYADAYANRGTAKRAKGDLDGSFADANAALKLDPKHAGAYFNRSLIHRQRGDNDAAITDCTEALKINPNYFEALTNRASARSAKGDLDGAIEDCTAALKINPRFAEALINRASAKKSKKDYDGTIADCDEALKINPKLPEALVNRGSAWFAKGDDERGLADFEKALEVAPPGWPHRKLIEGLVEKERARMRGGK